MPQPVVDADLNVDLSILLHGMDRAAILPLLALDRVEAADMHDVEIDSGLTMIDGDRFECAGNAYWTYQEGVPSLSDERYASITGRVVDGAPVVERIAVSVH